MLFQHLCAQGFATSWLGRSAPITYLLGHADGEEGSFGHDLEVKCGWEEQQRIDSPPFVAYLGHREKSGKREYCIDPCVCVWSKWVSLLRRRNLPHVSHSQGRCSNLFKWIQGKALLQMWVLKNACFGKVGRATLTTLQNLRAETFFLRRNKWSPS